MTRMFLDHLDNAYQGLRSNRTRSILTTFGIAIGIASVTCILAISDGVSRTIDGQIKDFHGDLAIIRPIVGSQDPNLYTSPIAQQSFNASSLTKADVTAVRAIPHVAAVAPLMIQNGTITSSDRTIKNAVILSTTADFVKTTPVSMKSGQFLSDDIDSHVAIVGEQLAIDLFGTDRPIGQQCTIRGQTFTISGVMKRDGRPVNYNSVDLSNALITPLSGGTLLRQTAQIQQINILADDATHISSVTNTVNDVVQKQHQGEQDFAIMSGHAISNPSSQLFRAIANVMTAIAAISLFVGGIGIMNIMLVGVAERTREIGIRKAVGASNGTIVSQFLIESLMISLLGGLFGYLLGYVLAFMISTFLYFVPSFTWITFAAALGMATTVGVIFGLYPALKASRKDTIQSLKQYH